MSQERFDEWVKSAAQDYNRPPDTRSRRTLLREAPTSRSTGGRRRGLRQWRFGSLVAAATAAGRRGEAFSGDIAVKAEVEALMAGCREALGRLNVLVVNAAQCALLSRRSASSSAT